MCHENSHCSNIEHFCKEGHCINSCITKEDCPPKEGHKEFCKDGICYYIPFGCNTDEECPSGHRCYNSRCIQIDCSTNEQCELLIGQEGFYCNKGKCVESNTCKSHKYCKSKHGKDFRCIRGHCGKVCDI